MRCYEDVVQRLRTLRPTRRPTESTRPWCDPVGRLRGDCCSSWTRPTPPHAQRAEQVVHPAGDSGSAVDGHGDHRQVSRRDRTPATNSTWCGSSPRRSQSKSSPPCSGCRRGPRAACSAVQTDASTHREPRSRRTRRQSGDPRTPRSTTSAASRSTAQPRDDLFTLRSTPRSNATTARRVTSPTSKSSALHSNWGGAGEKTVTKLLASAVYLFASNPDQWTN